MIRSLPLTRDSDKEAKGEVISSEDRRCTAAGEELNRRREFGTPEFCKTAEIQEQIACRRKIRERDLNAISRRGHEEGEGDGSDLISVAETDAEDQRRRSELISLEPHTVAVQSTV
ncbi:hypothetical protein MRB53_001172 [Persea americana]|uniref:Uncharacterized protein n=1 Tax=Persea americana TaxID=3435 RepID=A0ACC2MRY9_PERAE|nr:hypothetical protein MRB53_001172 [Persea americana]